MMKTWCVNNYHRKISQESHRMSELHPLFVGTIARMHLIIIACVPHRAAMVALPTYHVFLAFRLETSQSQNPRNPSRKRIPKEPIYIYIYIHTIEHELNRIQYRLYKLHMFEIPDMLLSNTEPIADWCAGGGRVSNPSLRSHKSTAEVAESEEAVPHGPVERSDAKQTGRSWP